MQDLIESTSGITNEKNSQTMSAAHLLVIHQKTKKKNLFFYKRKQCIKSIERFDFLSEIVERAPDVDPEKESKRGRPRFASF